MDSEVSLKKAFRLRLLAGSLKAAVAASGVNELLTKEKTPKDIRLSKECRPSFGRNVVEHTALRENPPNWKLDVKCRDLTQFPPVWFNLHEMYPNACVVETKTNLIVDLNEPQNPADVVVAAFGTPGIRSRKRTQLITFSKHFPEEGRVEVFVLLIDDTQNAFEGICARQEAQGKYMLAPMAVLFVGAEDEEDVKVQISDIEAGWKLDGAMEKVFAFQPILNSAELDINDIPSHCFVFKNTNTSKSCLSCKITATHTRDQAVVDVLKSFKTVPRLLKNASEDSSPPRKRKIPRAVSGKVNICATGGQFSELNVWLGLVLFSLRLTEMFLQIRECRSQKMVEGVIPAWQQCQSGKNE